MLGEATALLHRHAHAGVRDLHDDPARGLRGRPDGERSAPGHGVHRVVDPAHEGVARSKALPSTGGRASMSWVTAMTVPLRSASSRQRGVVSSRASGSPRAGPPAVGGLGLARNELLQFTDRRGRLKRHVTDHHQPPARRLRLALAQHQLGVGEDGGQRVVEVVARPPTVSPSARRSSLRESPRRASARRRPRSRPSSAWRARSGPSPPWCGGSGARCPGSPRGRRRAARRPPPRADRAASAAPCAAGARLIMGSGLEVRQLAPPAHDGG